MGYAFVPSALLLVALGFGLFVFLQVAPPIQPSPAPSFEQDFRESLFRMVAVLAALGVTVLMTSELEDRYTDLRFSPYGSAFLTDAIIVERYIEIQSKLKRVMAVVKMRGSAHSDELRQFEITDAGIIIGKPVVDYDGLLSGRPTSCLKPKKS